MTIGNKQSPRHFWGTYNDVYLGVPSYNPAASYFGILEGKKWNGTDDPVFKKKIERLESATNAYQFDRSRLIYALPARQKIIYSPVYSNTTLREAMSYGSVTDPLSWSSYEIDYNTNLAVHKIFAKIRDLESPIAGLEFLGEFRETIKAIRNPAEALAAYANKHASKQLDRLTKRRSRRAILKSKYSSKPKLLEKRLIREDADWSRTLAASVLEFNFGAAPLVKTLQAAAQAAVQTFPHQGAVKILKSTFKSSVGRVGPRINTSVGSLSLYQQDADEYEYSVTIVCRVKYAGQYDGMSQLEQLAALSGLSWPKVLPVLWELAPLSVFVDYFANVGSVLEAATTSLANVVSVDRYVTRQLIRRTSLNFVPAVVSNAVIAQESSGGAVTHYYKRYTREAWALVIPTLVFTTPASSLKKLGNLASFLRLALFKN